MPRRRLTHRKAARREELELEHRGSRRVHELGCGCTLCLPGGVRIDGELVDPDSMEDEDQPYFWNRRLW